MRGDLTEPVARDDAYDSRVDDSSRADTTDTVQRLEAARVPVTELETDRALARLESALFGGPTRQRVLDRYPLIRKLGQGGSGVVYLAYDPRLDRKVAIKLLSHVPSSGRSAADSRLLREAQAMARSPHPNIVAVYDVGTFRSEPSGRDTVFIVMEYAEGPDLDAWLARPHAWREVVQIFIEAGRGLAAAHAVGVTHRDFKPANAIVGDDGRVRVLDFGLARGFDSLEPETWVSGSDTTRHPELESPLTEEGAVLGTPAYMAPEQHAGLPANPATDQFNYCVALWEGLFGKRPYFGRSLAELADAKLAGPPPVPSAFGVPQWLVDVVVRGLAPDPERRWPSMDRLLDALVAGLGSRRRRGQALLGAGVVASLAVGSWLATHDDTSPCAGASTHLATVWGSARRAQVQSAFEATKRPYASASFESVSDGLDRFAADWSEQRTTACEATVVHGEQSAALMDLRMACLDRQIRAVDALITVLEEVDAQTLNHAFETVNTVPDPTACGNTEALLAAVAPPAHPELQRAVDQVRERLARAEALSRAGRVPEALALAQELAEHAKRLGYRPLLAEALTDRGKLEEHNGDYEHAEQTLAQAHALALASGHDYQAARASQHLVFVIGDRRKRLEDGLRWAEISEAEYERAGRSDERAGLMLARSTSYQVAGQLEAAQQHALEALALAQEGSGSKAYLVAVIHINLGEQLRELGDLVGARSHLELAHEIWLRELGPDHPELAMVLHNLGLVDLEGGDLGGAALRFRQAVEIRERALGPNHPLLATSLSNLGVVLRRRGELVPARATFERAAEILVDRVGPEALELGPVYTNLGVIDREVGDLAAARAHLEQAIALQHDSEHPNHARTLHNHASVLVDLGELDAAMQSFERSVEINARVFGPGHATLAERRLDLANTLHLAGHTAAGVQLAREAREQLSAAADPSVREAIEIWLAEVDHGYPEPGGIERAGL